MLVKKRPAPISLSMVSLAWFWQALTRRKVVDSGGPPPAEGAVAGGSSEEAPADAAASGAGSPLARVLTTLDLTALGVGSTLGVGVYVLAGSVARDYAGPAVILSFAIAAVASVFAGLCYAEFGARVPLAGSAYIYSYVTIGEFVAFVIGWNLIMEYVIGSASVARGLSNYLDQLMGNVMQDSFQSFWRLHVDFLSPYVDFFAFFVSFLLSVVLAFGVKESMSLNNLFTAVNMTVVLFVIIAGSFKADIANWQIDKATIPTDVRGGQGGFFPFGVMGVLRGAATCFYGFIGFDCIATTGEEVRNPQRAIPIAIIVSLVIIFLSYFGVSAVLTLMWPYYLQDPDAPLPYVFEQIGWPLAQWTVAIGGIFGLFASLFGAMYPLPRVIYAMASDGLIFKFLGEVHPKYKTPLVGTLLAGVITGVMAALFKLQQLVNMLSIGTLVAYTIVAACVLLLRYSNEVLGETDKQVEEEAVSLLCDSEKLTDDIYRKSDDSDDMGVAEYKETTNLVSLKEKPTVAKLFAQVFNWRGLKTPTATTSRLVNIEVVLFCGLSVALGLCLVHMENQLIYGHWDALVLVCLICSLLLLVVLSIALQPSSSQYLAFKVPFVPFIPAFSITLNIYLILMLDLNTWIRFTIWMAIGVGLFFISLACRDKKWCGCTPNPDAVPVQAAHALETTIPPLSNGFLDKDQSKVDVNDVSKDLYHGDGISLYCNGLQNQENFQLHIHDAITVSSNHSSNQNVEVAPPPIVQNNSLRNDESLMVNSMLRDETFSSCENCTEEKGLKTFLRADSLDTLSYECDDISITEATNDMLSLTFKNELKPEESGSAVSASEQSRPDEEEKSICSIARKNLENVEASGSQDSMTLNNMLPDFQMNDMNPEDNKIEDDVRSLYPDVVVISSSEEDLHSRSSRASTPTLGEENVHDCTSSEHGTAELQLMSVSEPSSKSADNISVKEADEKPNSEEIEPPNHVSLGPTKTVTYGPLETEEDSESEKPSILKNSSFVETLEKIIGAQSLKCKLSSHPSIRKSKSMVDMSDPKNMNSSKSTNLSDFHKSSPSADHGDSKEQDSNNSDRSSNKDSENDSMNLGIRRESEDMNAIGDIRAKLERIFSNGISSIPSSPTSPISQEQSGSSNRSLVHQKSFPAKELYEKNIDEAKNVPVDFQQEMDETKKRMASVLGTIRLRKTPRASGTTTHLPSKIDLEHVESLDNHLTNFQKLFAAKEWNHNDAHRSESSIPIEELNEVNEAKKQIVNNLGSTRPHNFSDSTCTQ